jgi:hypothetical protein
MTGFEEEVRWFRKSKYKLEIGLLTTLHLSIILTMVPLGIVKNKNYKSSFLTGLDPCP